MDLDVAIVASTTHASSVERVEYPDYATIFASVCASVFAVVGVIGEQPAKNERL